MIQELIDKVLRRRKLPPVGYRQSRHEARRGHPVLFDYRKTGWGHSFSITKAEKATIWALGHGQGIEGGDYVLLTNHNDGGKETRYQFIYVDYYYDPRDMWSAMLEYAPRKDGDKELPKPPRIFTIL